MLNTQLRKEAGILYNVHYMYSVVGKYYMAGMMYMYMYMYILALKVPHYNYSACIDTHTHTHTERERNYTHVYAFLNAIVRPFSLITH